MPPIQSRVVVAQQGAAVRAGGRSATSIRNDLVPITNFFQGTAIAMFDLSVFESLTFGGGEITNIANLLNPGTYDLNCASEPVGYDATGIDGRPAGTSNGVDHQSGTINLAGAGIAIGDTVAAHLIFQHDGYDGSTGYFNFDQLTGPTLRANATNVIFQTSAGPIFYDLIDVGVPHADQVELSVANNQRVRRDGGSWQHNSLALGALGADPTTVVWRNGGQYEPVRFGALVITKDATETQMDEWLAGYVAPRFPTIAGALP